MIPWPEPPQDLSTEVSRAKAAKPDVIAPITRPARAQLLLPEIRKQRLDILGIVGPGSPGLYEAGQLAVLKEDLEFVMSNLPWANFKNPRTQKAAEDYLKRSGGKTFDTNSATRSTVMLIADILERMKSADPDVIVEAIKKTHYTNGLTPYAAGRLNEIGDNPNAVTTMVQISARSPSQSGPRRLRSASVFRVPSVDHRRAPTGRGVGWIQPSSDRACSADSSSSAACTA